MDGLLCWYSVLWIPLVTDHQCWCEVRISSLAKMHNSVIWTICELNPKPWSCNFELICTESATEVPSKTLHTLRAGWLSNALIDWLTDFQNLTFTLCLFWARHWQAVRWYLPSWAPSLRRGQGKPNLGVWNPLYWDQRGLFRSRCLDKVPRQELEESRYRTGVVREELF